jgi:hypothetical protein
MPAVIDPIDLARQLAAATRKGGLRWQAEPDSEDVFVAELSGGKVRLARLVMGPAHLLELLDPAGRSLYHFESDVSAEEGALEALFALARSQAFQQDAVVAGLLKDIRQRAGEE